MGGKDFEVPSYLENVGEEPTKAVEIAKKLRIGRISILTGWDGSLFELQTEDGNSSPKGEVFHYMATIRHVVVYNIAEAPFTCILSDEKGIMHKENFLLSFSTLRSLPHHVSDKYQEESMLCRIFFPAFIPATRNGMP